MPSIRWLTWARSRSASGAAAKLRACDQRPWTGGRPRGRGLRRNAGMAVQQEGERLAADTQSAAACVSRKTHADQPLPLDKSRTSSTCRGFYPGWAPVLVSRDLPSRRPIAEALLCGFVDFLHSKQHRDLGGDILSCVHDQRECRRSGVIRHVYDDEEIGVTKGIVEGL